MTLASLGVNVKMLRITQIVPALAKTLTVSDLRSSLDNFGCGLASSFAKMRP
jgi:hypothetical protein